MEKPVLVIIGEAHPSGIEQMLIMKGELHVKAREAKGMKRIAIDRSKGYARSREGIRRINEEIIKKEAELLKKEKIARLLLERPRSQETKWLYEGFRRTHDLKEMKRGLREDADRLNVQTMRDIKALFDEFGLCRPLMGVFMEQCKGLTERGVQPMLTLSHISVAYKAGVYDLVPVDDAEGFRQSGALPDALYVLYSVIDWLFRHPGAAFGKYSEDELMGTEKEYWRIKALIDRRLLRVETGREKTMCRNIVESFMPGSALICGIGHLKPLEERLSKRFDLRIYEVGERLNDSVGRGLH